MGAPFVKALLRITIVAVGLWGIGQILSRRLTEGDAESDEFTIATFFGGTERTSTARELRRGSIVTCCGGVELDLRPAVLDPNGADLTVQATMGGVQVTVPDTWRVLVESETHAGGIDVSVTRPEDVPDDAPVLRVHAVARMGGVMVTRGEEHP